MSAMLAMHMSNELLSLPMAAGTMVLAAVVVGVAAWRARASLDPATLPLMGVMGAFVFAAQMLNFPIGFGISGHFGGTVLLAVLLGPWAAILTMTSILIVQCLLFADGGLLALGCNILNIGVVPALLGGGLYNLVRGASSSPRRLYMAAWLGATVGVLSGAALVPLQVTASGVLLIPLHAFLPVILGAHVAIGLAEGAITFAVLAYLQRTRPQLFHRSQGQIVGATIPAADDATYGAVGGEAAGADHRPGQAAVLTSLLGTALLLAGAGVWFASTADDGLEASLDPERYNVAAVIHNDHSAIARADAIQAAIAPLPDYTKPDAASDDEPAGWLNVSGWSSLAGLLGTIVTLGLVRAVAQLLKRRDQVTSQRVNQSTS